DPRTGTRPVSRAGSSRRVLVLADRFGAHHRRGREPGLGGGAAELAGGLLDRLLAAAALHARLRADPAAADPGGDAAAGGDRVGQLDDLLPGQHAVALGLDPDAPPHGMLLIRVSG